MLGAVMFGHKEFQPVIDACIRMAEKAAKEPRDVPENDDSELKAKVAGIAEDGLKAAYQEADKQTRQEKVAELRDAVNAELVAEDASPDERIAVSGAFKGLESDIVRGGISIPKNALTDAASPMCARLFRSRRVAAHPWLKPVHAR